MSPPIRLSTNYWQPCPLHEPSTMIDSLSQEQLNKHPAIASLTDMVRLRYGARELSGFPKIQARQMLAGGHKSSFRGRGMDFDQVRLYQPGDDVRTIDWRVTARTQTPHTKIFSEERERPILVNTDCINYQQDAPTD